MVVLRGAGLFVVRVGGLDSSCAVNGFGMEVVLTGGYFNCVWGEVQCKELSHDTLANEMMDGIGDEIWSLTKWTGCRYLIDPSQSLP